MVVRPDGHRVKLDVSDSTLAQKADICSEQGVEVLICGAISNVAYAMLAHRGIKVISWLGGPVSELIEAYREKRDMVGLYGLPGCGKRRCRKTGFGGPKRRGRRL